MRRRSASAAAALVRGAIVVALVGSGLLWQSVQPAAAAAEPVLVWSAGGMGPVRESSPVPVDIDNDGRLDVAFGSRDGLLWVLGPDGNRASGWPQPTGNPIDSSPSVADTDGDLRPELFIGSGTYEAPSGALVSFEHDGNRRFTFVAHDNTFAAPSIHTTPALADVAGSAGIDVTFGSLGVESIWSLSQGGVVHPGFPYYADDTVFSSPAVLDANGDGRDDFVIGGDASAGPTFNPVNHQGGLVRAITGSGQLIWQLFTDDIIRSPVTVGDIDGDGSPDVVFGGGDYWGGNDSVKVWALDRNGNVKPGWPISTDGVPIAEPTLADVDGNGVLDVVIGTFSSTHDHGNGGSIYAVKGNGAPLPGFPRASDGGVVVGSIATADLDGDGGQDLIVPTGGGIYAYSGRNGAKQWGVAVGQAAFQNTPLVTDIEGDGELDLIAVGTKDNAGVAYRWRLGPSARLGSNGWHQFRKDNHHTGSWVQGIPANRAVGVQRISGADRYATAAAIGRAAYPDGAPTVVLATGEKFADALGGGPVATKLGGPVLLVTRDMLPSATAGALDSLSPARVLVLGGESAVSQAVVAQVAARTGVVPERIAGDDRYATAAAASAAAFSPGVPVAYVSNGEGFADALAGGAAGATRGGPVLLVTPSSVPGATAAELDRLHPARIIVLGGAAAVSDAVAAQLRSYSGSVVRTAGADRYATGAAVSAESIAGPVDIVVVTTGQAFPDALAGAALAAALDTSLLLVPRGCVPDVVRNEIDRLGATRMVVLGGTAAVINAVGALPHCE